MQITKYNGNIKIHNSKISRSDSVVDPPAQGLEVAVRSLAATDQKSWKYGTSSSLPIFGIERLRAGKYDWSTQCRLITWLAGMLACHVHSGRDIYSDAAL